jgi:hypothetical protein
VTLAKPYIRSLAILVSFSAFAQVAQVHDSMPGNQAQVPFFSSLANDDPDTTKKKLRFPLKKDHKPGDGKDHPLDLDDSKLITKSTDYDTSTGEFVVNRRLGDSTELGGNERYTLDEYMRKSNDEYMKNYFRGRSMAHNFTANSNSLLNFKIKSDVLKDVLGEEFVDIKPQGSAELIFMYEINKVENPAWPVRVQRQGQFKFDQKIRLSVAGKIGDKINLNLNFDTETNFEFDNQIKLNFQGKEDDIIKSPPCNLEG